MDADRWDEVKRIFDGAVDLDAIQRAEHLDRECGGDAALRAEVEGLLGAHEKAGPFLDTVASPAANLALPKAGSTISHYVLGELLGGGGMGLVFRATDVDLEREVAIKFLPPEWGRDPVANERFMREARAASSLDHPNICTVYEVGQTDEGHLFIAMAYYVGQTLKEKLATGPLPLRQTLDEVAQAATGLREAHALGIVHRDIKPANVIVTTAGLVKVLDFGLAMFTGQQRLTQTGSTLGTIAYMAPEALRHEEVDPRVDIWSLGVVTYELLSGELPFPGHHDQAIIYSILNEEPDELTLPEAGAEAAVNGLLVRALEKNPSDRFQSMDEMLAAIERARDAVSPTLSWPAVPQRRSTHERRDSPSHRRLRGVLAGALLLVVLAVVGWFSSRRPDQGPVESATGAGVTAIRDEVEHDLAPWLQHRPDSEEAVSAFRLGVEYAYRRMPGGEKHYRLALGIDADFIGPRVWLVSSLMARGANEEAAAQVAELESRYATATPFERAMIDWAAALVARDPIAEARHLVVASRLAPENRLVRYTLGSKSAELGRFEESYQVLDPLAQARWPLPSLYSTWSYVAIETGHVDGVRERLETTALGIDPVSTTVYGVLEALCWWEGDEKCAVEYGTSFRREVSRPDSRMSFAAITPIYIKLAEISTDRGDAPKGVEMMQRAVDLDPENDGIRMQMALTLAEAGRVQEATALYAELREVPDAEGELLYRLGRVAEELGRSDDAIRHYRRYLELQPDGPWAVASRGAIRRVEASGGPALQSGDTQ